MPLKIRRTEGESITLSTAIGDVIVVTVAKLGRGRVELVIDAPQKYRITRNDEDRKKPKSDPP